MSGLPSPRAALAAFLLVVTALCMPLPLEIFTYGGELASHHSRTSDLYPTLILHQQVQHAMEDVYHYAMEQSWSVQDKITFVVQGAQEVAFRTRSWNILDIVLLRWPLERLFSPLQAWNLLFFLLALLNAAAGWWVGYHFSGSRLGAAVSGLVWAFNPLCLIYAQEGRPMQVCLFFFAPVLVAADHLINRRGGLGWILLGGVSLALLAQFYWFYGIFAGVTVGVLWLLSPEPLRLAPPFKLGLVGALSLLLSLPGIRQLERTDREDPSRSTLPRASGLPREFPPPEGSHMSQDQRVLLTDSLPLEAPLMSRMPGHFAREANIGEVGLALLVLAGVGLTRRRAALPWAVLAVSSWLMTLGPWIYLGVADRWLTLGDRPVANHLYLLFYDHAAIFRQFLHPYRFVVLEFIALGVLGACGVSVLAERMASAEGRQRRLIAAGLGGGIVLAFLPQLRAGQLPVEMTEFPRPEEMLRLVDRSRPSMVLHVPVEALGHAAPEGTPEGDMWHLPPPSGEYEKRKRLIQMYHRQDMLFLEVYPQLKCLPPKRKVGEPPPGLFFMRQWRERPMPAMRGQPGNDPTLMETWRQTLREEHIRWVILDEAGVMLTGDVETSAARYEHLREEFRAFLGPERLETTLDNEHFLTFVHPTGFSPERLRLAVFELK